MNKAVKIFPASIPLQSGKFSAVFVLQSDYGDSVDEVKISCNADFDTLDAANDYARLRGESYLGSLSGEIE